MRTLMKPLALMASLGAGGAALGDSTSGTIADVSDITGNVTLENGMTFRFTEENSDILDNFKPGDAVAIEWIAVGDRMEGRQISPAGNGDRTLTGVVAEASDVTGWLTLANGTTIDFSDAGDVGLGNFRPGDTVSVQYVTVGDDIRGLSVSPANAPANVATGTIQELNEGTGSVIFADGSSYDFNGMDDEMLDNFSVGDRVSVHYLTQGDAMVALSISPVS